MSTMTYEEYLDEVTTLLTELYELEDSAAIKLVVDAQDDGYFIKHDEVDDLRTAVQAGKDAVALYEQIKTRCRRRKSSSCACVKRSRVKRPVAISR
ncbi:hypothetical protein [Rugamonas sp.]|uniref:hypothetical protein n=1 Tax=Rugamonas sp. TaxID=1926287 RepID=UPI00345BA6A6